MGVPIIRTIVYWGPPILGKLPNQVTIMGRQGLGFRLQVTIMGTYSNSYGFPNNIVAEIKFLNSNSVTGGWSGYVDFHNLPGIV